jgi:hypothetical protein
MRISNASMPRFMCFGRRFGRFIRTRRLRAALMGALTATLMGAITPAAAGAQSTGTASGASSRTDSVPHVRFGAFVDGYYAWDAGQPPARDRAFAGGTVFGTQPSRHNEFNINLAFVEAMLTAPRYRGRLAVQFGTSVQANYAGEPTVGQISGPSVQQYLQEAYAGVRLADRTWIDGGIFFSNAGMEGWISRDNLTYTRSLVADYSPYYSTGVRLIHQATPTLTMRLDVVNGWQNISENNQGKGAGLRLDWTPAAAVSGDATSVSYYNLVSEEAGTRPRLFNGVGMSVRRGHLTVLGQADVGVQRRAVGDNGWSRWYGLLAGARVQVTPAAAIVGRVERYVDPDQVILRTGAMRRNGIDLPNAAFRGNSASLGVDVRAAAGALWRTEARVFHNREAIFPDGSRGAPRRGGGFVVSSLAVSF